MRKQLKRACWGALIGGIALPLAASLAMTLYLSILGTLDEGFGQAVTNVPTVFLSSLYYGFFLVLLPGLVTGFFLGLGWRMWPGN